jgi:FMNH2-dependent dimethyl sulfone monooxygenase
MRLGIWCPAPLSIRPDALVQPAFDALTRHGGGVDQNYLYAVDVLRRAEELGFEITLIAQRFFGPDLDSWMLGAALAAQTTSIEIMAAVHPGIMDPRVVAKHAASADRISGGRFCVNVVNGSRPQEFEVFGKLLASGEERYRRMHEFIQVMKGMWLHEDFKFKGEFYSVDYETVPTKSVRAPHPPIYAASRVDEGMNVVARECDAWFVNSSRDYREYEDGLKRMETEVGLMERRCGELGREMQYGLSACVLMADTDDQAIAIADGYVAQLARDPSIKSASVAVGANLIGSPKTVLERIRRYESLGIDLFMLQFYPMRQGLEEFALKILPELTKGSVRHANSRAAVSAGIEVA